MSGLNWKAFKDEVPSKDGMYLYASRMGGWKRARWRDGKFTESCGANRIELVSPDFWAEVELP
jgi:hypothetical protein